MISGHKITQIPPHIKTSTQGACVKNGNIMTKRQKGQKKVERPVLVKMSMCALTTVWLWAAESTTAK